MQLATLGVALSHAEGDPIEKIGGANSSCAPNKNHLCVPACLAVQSDRPDHAVVQARVSVFIPFVHLCLPNFLCVSASLFYLFVYRWLILTHPAAGGCCQICCLVSFLLSWRQARVSSLRVKAGCRVLCSACSLCCCSFSGGH